MAVRAAKRGAPKRGTAKPVATPDGARWRRRKEERPGEILAAALETFVERGYAATRLDDVAKRAGVTKGTLYLYFPNKEELFKAVVRAALVPTLERVAEAAAQAQVPIATVMAGLFASFKALASSPVVGLPKLVLAESGNFPEIARFYHDEVVARGLAGIKALLDRGVASGEFRLIDTSLAAFCVAGPLLLALLWARTMGPVSGRTLDFEALSKVHLDLLLNGLRRKEASP